MPFYEDALSAAEQMRKEEITAYYLPGSNANIVTIRKEVNYYRNYHGHGDIADVEVTAEKAFKAINCHDELLAALKLAENYLSHIAAQCTIGIEPFAPVLIPVRAAIAKAEAA